MKIVADAHIPFVSDYFSHYGDLILIDGRKITANDVHDADILLVRSITPVNAELLEHSKVKFVGSITAGFDHLDTTWLQQNNITFACALGFNAPPVADYIVCVLATLGHALPQLNKPFRAAVIGIGHVGRLVVKHLRLLQAEVITCDPLRADEPDFQHTDFAQIKDCDVISLHVPLVKTGQHVTYQMVNETFLKQQKPNAVLINTSRGDVLDNAALWAFGQHLHWCLDVWPNEPDIDDKLLQKASIATPHIAGYSIQSKRRGIDAIYQTLVKNNIIPTSNIMLPPVLKQTLQLPSGGHTWQEVVTTIFNPNLLTSIMRTQLINHPNKAHVFDDLRAGFNYRYEFSASKIAKSLVRAEDQGALKQLGIELV